jgi:hypothetical protein
MDRNRRAGFDEIFTGVFMTRLSQNIGKHGQQQARSVLSGMGLEMVQPIATPVLLTRVPAQFLLGIFRRMNNIFRVVWGEQVNGDHTAILPNGRFVLIEVKTILDKNLVWSELRDHQPDALTQHAQFNELSLLVWVHDSGVYVMRWPIEGFGPGKGITPERAQVYHLRTCEYIREQLERSMEPAQNG